MTLTILTFVNYCATFRGYDGDSYCSHHIVPRRRYCNRLDKIGTEGPGGLSYLYIYD